MSRRKRDQHDKSLREIYASLYDNKPRQESEDVDLDEDILTILNGFSIEDIDNVLDGDYIQSAINESLDDNQKEVFLDQMANLSIHVLELINKITTLHGTPIMLKTLETNQNLSQNEQYQEFGLWRTIEKINAMTSKKTNKFLKRVRTQSEKMQES